MRSQVLNISRFSAFTLLELLVVIAIIILVAAFLIPALSPSSARTLDGATRQFAADLENARLIAIAERTRTRVILPQADTEFGSPSPPPTPWPNDIARRGYVIVSEKKTESMWRLRGKWNRLPQGIAVQQITTPSPSATASPTPTPTAMPITMSGTGSTPNYSFGGAYIEFLANGSCSLDPTASPYPAIIIAGGIVNSAGAFTQTDKNLKNTLTIDPLSGSVTIK